MPFEQLRKRVGQVTTKSLVARLLLPGGKLLLSRIILTSLDFLDLKRRLDDPIGQVSIDSESVLLHISYVLVTKQLVNLPEALIVVLLDATEELVFVDLSHLSEDLVGRAHSQEVRLLQRVDVALLDEKDVYYGADLLQLDLVVRTPCVVEHQSPRQLILLVQANQGVELGSNWQIPLQGLGVILEPHAAKVLLTSLRHKVIKACLNLLKDLREVVHPVEHAVNDHGLLLHAQVFPTQCNGHW